MSPPSLADDIAAAWIAICRALGLADPARALSLSAAEGGAPQKARYACINAVRRAWWDEGGAPPSPERFRRGLGLAAIAPKVLSVSASPSALTPYAAPIEAAVAAVRERRRR